MAKLDRLGWAAHRAIRTHGVRIGFRATRKNLLDALDPHLPPDAAPSRSRVVDRLYSIVSPINQPDSRVRRYQIVYSDAMQVARTLDLNEALQQMSADIGFCTAMLTPKYTFIHAGVVTWGGRAIVLPGTPHSGKTTLVHALIRAGATYYSDEWAVIDANGRVHPYARPLALRGTNGGRDSTIPVDALEGAVGIRSARVGLVALARFDPSARWQPRRLSPADATLEAIQHVVQLRLDPTKVLQAIGRLMSGATVVAGTRGEADETASALLARLDEEKLSFRRSKRVA